MKTLAQMLCISSLLAGVGIGCAAQATNDGTNTTETNITENGAKNGDRNGHEKATAEAKFVQWTLLPNGKIAGMLLDDGSFVRTHADAIKDSTTLTKGDVVRVEGLKMPGESAIYVRASVTTKDGKVVVEQHAGEFGAKHGHLGKTDWKGKSPEERKALVETWKAAHPGEELPSGHKHGEKRGHHGHGFDKMMGLDDPSLQPMRATGTIVAIAKGPHGKTIGAVLSDGTTAYFPRHAATGDLEIKKGELITLSGKGGEYPLGRSMVIQTILLPSGVVKDLTN